MANLNKAGDWRQYAVGPEAGAKNTTRNFGYETPSFTNPLNAQNFGSQDWSGGYRNEDEDAAPSKPKAHYTFGQVVPVRKLANGGVIHAADGNPPVESPSVGTITVTAEKDKPTTPVVAQKPVDANQDIFVEHNDPKARKVYEGTGGWDALVGLATGSKERFSRGLGLNNVDYTTDQYYQGPNGQTSAMRVSYDASGNPISYLDTRSGKYINKDLINVKGGVRVYNTEESGIYHDTRKKHGEAWAKETVNINDKGKAANDTITVAKVAQPFIGKLPQLAAPAKIRYHEAKTTNANNQSSHSDVTNFTNGVTTGNAAEMASNYAKKLEADIQAGKRLSPVQANFLSNWQAGNTAGQSMNNQDAYTLITNLQTQSSSAVQQSTDQMNVLRIEVLRMGEQGDSNVQGVLNVSRKLGIPDAAMADALIAGPHAVQQLFDTHLETARIDDARAKFLERFRQENGGNTPAPGEFEALFRKSSEYDTLKTNRDTRQTEATTAVENLPNKPIKIETEVDKAKNPKGGKNQHDKTRKTATEKIDATRAENAAEIERLKKMGTESTNNGDIVNTKGVTNYLNPGAVAKEGFWAKTLGYGAGAKPPEKKAHGGVIYASEGAPPVDAQAKAPAQASPAVPPPQLQSPKGVAAIGPYNDKVSATKPSLLTYLFDPAKAEVQEQLYQRHLAPSLYGNVAPGRLHDLKALHEARGFHPNDFEAIGQDIQAANAAERYRSEGVGFRSVAQGQNTQALTGALNDAFPLAKNTMEKAQIIAAAAPGGQTPVFTQNVPQTPDFFTGMDLDDDRKLWDLRGPSQQDETDEFACGGVVHAAEGVGPVAPPPMAEATPQFMMQIEEAKRAQGIPPPGPAQQGLNQIVGAGQGEQLKAMAADQQMAQKRAGFLDDKELQWDTHEQKLRHAEELHALKMYKGMRDAGVQANLNELLGSARNIAIGKLHADEVGQSQIDRNNQQFAQASQGASPQEMVGHVAQNNDANAQAYLDVYNRAKQGFANGGVAGEPMLRHNYAEGSAGVLQGPGTTKSDSIPAWLSQGEVVLPAEDVMRVGEGNPELGYQRLKEFAMGFGNNQRAQMADQGKLTSQHYANGGFVKENTLDNYEMWRDAKRAGLHNEDHHPFLDD